MRTSMMTLGCPNWDLDQVIHHAALYGYNGIDFRGLKAGLDITTLPDFTTHLTTSAKKIADAGLLTSGISSSLNICDQSKWDSNLEEARRTIPVATALNATYVRIFGGGNVAPGQHADAANIGRDCIHAILNLDGARNLKWLFETHDFWIKSTDCALLLNAIPDPAFGALWDIGHTSRVGGETPEQSYAVLGPRIANAHIKDALHDPAHPNAMPDEWRYVLPGQGQLPLAAGVELLAQKGYTGWLTFEHEKRWHPTLADPEVAFPAFIQWFKSLNV